MKKAGLCWQGTGVRWDVVGDPPAAMLSMVWKPGQETAALGEGHRVVPVAQDGISVTAAALTEHSCSSSACSAGHVGVVVGDLLSVVPTRADLAEQLEPAHRSHGEKLERGHQLSPKLFGDHAIYLLQMRPLIISSGRRLTTFPSDLQVQAEVGVCKATSQPAAHLPDVCLPCGDI